MFYSNSFFPQTSQDATKKKKWKNYKFFFQTPSNNESDSSGPEDEDHIKVVETVQVMIHHVDKDTFGNESDTSDNAVLDNDDPTFVANENDYEEDEEEVDDNDDSCSSNQTSDICTNPEKPNLTENKPATSNSGDKTQDPESSVQKWV